MDKNRPLKRILLAEDNENDIELTLEAFRQNDLGNVVDVVRDGSEALDYLFRRGKFTSRPEMEPDAILLDIKMPRVDGLEVLKVLKQDPVLKVIPVVMLTTSREDSDLLKCYDYGVNSFVVKPMDFAEFVRCVKTMGLFWGALNEPPPQKKD